MTITDGVGGTLLPYILDPTPNAATLNLPATNGVDTLNNMEQVVIDNPTAGTYTVNVSGTTIPQGPQKYYVIYEFITADIIVTYPVGGEGFAPGTTETIRWDAPVSTGFFTLEYTLDNGANWTNISSTISGSVRYFNWTVPNVLSGQVKVRVTRNSISGDSQMPFSIIGTPTNIQVISSCPNSFELTWNTVSGATAYEVSVLGSKYMDSVITVNTNSASITGYPASNSYWVSVKAKTSQAVGERAIAVEKQVGVWNCSLANDIELIGLLPSGNALFNCENYSNVNVTVRLKNIGVNAMSNIGLAYQFNSGTVVSGQYTGTINPGDSVDYSFTSTISFNSPNMYQLDIWKTAPDDNTFNDTLINPFQVYSGTTVTLPYSEDFETFSNCGVTSNCGGTSCSLTNGWKNLSNGVWDDIDFRTNNGGTPSSGTGPTIDHAPGTNQGKYLYLEASGGCEFQEAQVISPCIDLSSANSPIASIWYHMRGTNVGELHFDVLSNGKWYYDVVSMIAGNHGTAWIEQVIDLSAFTGGLVNIRMRGITGDGWSSDIAIDDFNVSDQSLVVEIIADSMPCYAAGPVTISNSAAGTGATYDWDFGTGATPATANTAGPHSVLYSSTGAKTVRLIVTEGSISDTAFKTITLVNLPVVSFTTFYNVNTDSLEFTNTSTDIGSSLWDFGDGSAVSQVTNPVHKYPNKGNYDVVLIVTNSCGSATLEQTVDNYPLGISNVSNDGATLSVYPNPGSGLVTIDIEGLQGDNGDLIIYDVNGKQVFAKSFEVGGQNTSFKVDLTHLGKGVYILGFTSENLTKRVRLVIQ